MVASLHSIFGSRRRPVVVMDRRGGMTVGPRQRALAGSLVACATFLLAACGLLPDEEVAVGERSRPAPSEAQAPGGPAMPAFLIARAQLLLTDLGYRPGAASGVAGAETEAAVRAFQANEGLSVDGRISAALLAQLDVAYQALSVRRAQVRLSALGYDPGPIDGTVGPRTRAAISVYEKDRELPVTAAVTPELLQRLYGEQPAPPSKSHAAAEGEAAGSSSGGADPGAAPFAPYLAALAPAAGVGGHAAGGAPARPAEAALATVSLAEVAGSASDDGGALAVGDRIRLALGPEGADVIEREIDADGRLALPGGFSVAAAGLTLAALKRAITVKLVESYLRTLSVEVSRPGAAEAVE